MKRTSLTTAVIAGIAGVAGISNMASAVYLNNDGLGSVLIYPYYTVNGNNNTLLSVVNTTSVGKAVKVRFLEGWDSREVLDFNLYLSAFDVWTAALIESDGGGAIFTPDNSCTVPPIPTSAASAYQFLTDALTDGGPSDVSRTTEGYVELIEMATIIANSPTSKSITHVSGVPSNCGNVNDAWNGGYWAANPQQDLAGPTGGLFGSGTIIDVGNGTVEAYNAEAIDQFYTSGNLVAQPQHSDPGNLLPNLTSGLNSTSYVFQNGALATSTYNFGIDAVSSLFMADAIYNEYVVDPSIGASTEWVVTFPTKRFYVDPGTSGSVAGTTAAQPFDELFGPITSDPSTAVSCSPVSFTTWDREEKSFKNSVGFSPPGKTPGSSLCWEAQVVTFNQNTAAGPGSVPSTILGSSLTKNIKLPDASYTAGWALLDLTRSSGTGSGAVNNHKLTPASNGNVFIGLPTTGFSVTEYVNGTLGSSLAKEAVLANYTGLYRHKYHRTCTNAGGSCQ